MNSKIILLLLASLAISVGACSRCDEPKAEEEKAVAPELTTAVAKKGTTKLEWEWILPGVKTDAFVAKLGEMAALSEEDAKARIQCGDQQAIGVVNPAHARIEEHTAGDDPLRYCQLDRASAGKSWILASARGVFAGDILVSVVWRFRHSNYDMVKGDLVTRFGDGETRTLEDKSLLGEKNEPVLLWQVDDLTYALRKHKGDVSLEVQDSKRLLALPTPADALEKTPLGKLDGTKLTDDDLVVDPSQL